MSKDIPLSEPVYCPPVFATGFFTEKIGETCVQLTFYLQTASERIVVAKIIRPIAMLVAPRLVLAATETIDSMMDMH